MKKNYSFSKVNVKDETKRKMKESLSQFYFEQMGEDIPLVLEDSLIDFFLEEYGPIIYNIALDDSMEFMKEKFKDIESDHYSLYKDEK